MLSSLWWLPLAVAACALYPLWRGARRLVDEVAGLEASITELRQVRPLVLQVTAEMAAIELARRDLHDLGHR